MDWTPERDARLTKLWNQPDPVLSIRLIGSMMDTTHNAVVGRARRLGLPGRPSPIKPLNPDAKPRRAGKVTLSATHGPVVKAMTTPVHPQTQDVVSFEDWTRIPYTKKAERLPIPVGAIGRARECQWPLTDGRPWAFCGDACMDGYSYCVSHKARAFVCRQAFAA